MSETKVAQHTPGPWRVEPQWNGRMDIRGADNTICGGVWRGAYGEPGSIGQANAKLMAAAPELLEALETYELPGGHMVGCTAGSLPGNDCQPVCIKARAAIDAARKKS